MLFSLSTPEYRNVQANTTRVKVHLKNGVAEIFDKHLDLMGLVENNLVEIETNFENKFEKFVFTLQEAVFVVSNKGLDEDIDIDQTSIYVYAKRAQEIGPTLSIDSLSQQYDEYKAKLEVELEKAKTKAPNIVDAALNVRINDLQKDVEFFKRTLLILKDMKV